MAREKQGSRLVAVGVVVSVAIVILAAAILIIGQESRMFSHKVRYRTNFIEVLGLKVGSPVYMSGVQIGTVDSIELPTDPKQTGIELMLAVDRKYAGRVRVGTKASLAFLQVLSGDKLVILTPGDPGKPALPEGSHLVPEQPPSFLEAGTSAAENLNQITSKLNEILGPIERGEGLLGKMINDPDFGQEGLANVNAAFVQAREILGKINSGEGFLGQLIVNRESARETLDSLHAAARKIESVLEQAQQGKGAIGSLLKEGGEGEQAIAELRASAAELRGVLEQVRSGRGLLSRLIYDEAFGDRLAEDMKRSASSLASILEKIDAGEGTLGGLVNDPQVYEGLRDIVGGVKQSWLGKKMVTHYQKKGVKAREEQEGAPAPPAEGPQNR